MRHTKGQVSTELLVIVGIILLVFIPILVTVYFKSNETNQELKVLQAELAVTRLASSINSVGNLGAGSMLAAEVFVPENTQSIRFVPNGARTGGEIIFSVKIDGNKLSEFVKPVRFPVNFETIDAPAQGYARFDVIAQENEEGAPTVSVTRK